MTTGYEAYRAEFADAKLPIASIPEALRESLRRVRPLEYNTLSQQPVPGVLQIREYSTLDDLQAGKLEEFTGVAFWGLGFNSYRIHYEFFYKRLLLLTEVFIGGVYSNQEKTTSRAQALFDRVENLLIVLDEAQKAGRMGKQEYIIVHDYSSRGKSWQRFDVASGIPDIRQNWQESSDPIQDAVTSLTNSLPGRKDAT
ncbi:MAG: hypothetical protein AAF787_00700 [Chloroflexota bacterium]